MMQIKCLFETIRLLESAHDCPLHIRGAVEDFTTYLDM